MVYVERDGGLVVGIYANPQPGRAEEELADNHADVLAFRNPPPDLNAYLADKRFRVETGGIVIPGDPPMPCWTDRATQSMLGRVLDSIDRSFVTAPLNIKTPAGASAMSAEQISGIAALVAQHVQQCFDIEASLSAQIALGNITTTGEIDAAAWPSNT